MLKFANDINSEYVGVIREYSVIPSKPIFLVYIILIISPNILVIHPPISRINVDFINLFFVGFSPL